MPTFAPIPTFGFTLVVLPPGEPDGVPAVAPDWPVVELPDGLVVELCEVAAPCVIEDDELMSVDCWLADTPLDTLWSPLPILTPGLIFAPALTSVLLMPTFASTPT